MRSTLFSPVDRLCMKSNPSTTPLLDDCQAKLQRNHKMEAFTWCKELWTPKTFNKFSFLVNVLWIAVGIVLFGVFLDMEINESRFDFRCDVNKNAKVDKDFVRQKCFVEYEKLHNKLSVPLYSFVIVNFSLPFIVCVIYSILAKPRVNKLESRNTDVEGQNHQATTTQRKLFIQYCCQLATRFCLGIVFILLLLYEVFYPREFPSNFKCNLMREVNQTAANATGNTKTPSYQCINQRAHKKTSWMYAVSGANGILAALLLIEIFVILSRVRKWGKHFVNDLQFYTDHLVSTGNYNPLEEPRQLVERLHGECSARSPPGSAQLETSIKSMKESVLETTDRLRDLSSPLKPNPGEGDQPKDFKLDQIYTNLIFHPGRADYDFPENRREQLKVYPKPEKKLPPNRPGDIIDDQHKNILIVGRPVIGKTLCCMKVLRDWASDHLFDEAQTSVLRFDVAFLVKFRRLNFTAELNLRELLCLSEFSTNMTDEVWHYVVENPSKVLFIFDGIDEYSARKEIQEHVLDPSDRNTLEQKMPVGALYTNIASGKLLKGATVLTTTRPTAVSCLRNPNPSRVVEILGFSSGQVKNYVEKYTGDDEDAGETIWKHISSNLNLFSLCYIPVNCFIICSCLLYMLQSIHGLTSLPTKLTSIYSFAVKLIFFRHSERYRNKTDDQDEIFKKFDELADDVQGDFKKLGTVAFKGIKDGRLTFESDEVTNLEDCGLLHRLPDLKPEVKRPFGETKAQYCFQHLTIQEFFAAKHVTDIMKGDKLEEFVNSHIKDGAWQMVLQFVAGLLSDREEPLTDIFTNLLPVWTYEEEEQEVDPSKVTCWPSKEDAQLALTLCHCLNEIDAAVQNKVLEIAFNAVVLKYCRLGPVDCTAIVNFLKKHNEILLINLSGNKIGCLGCKEISEFLESSRSVSDGNCKLSSLNLNHNLVTDEGVKYLAEALKHNNCKLNSLNLADNELTNEGVKCLAEALKHSNCTLSSLHLNNNLLTDKGVESLAEALKHSNCKLKNLNLAGNELVTDEGVKYLAEALKDSNCKLNSLNLWWQNNVTRDEGVTCLAEALKNSNCKLNSLNLRNLGGNEFTDEGVKNLAKALKHSNCKLNRLNLTGNEFTDEGVKYLAEALKDGDCELKSLDLACNKLTDEGVKCLAKALKNSSCKLNSLTLWQNNVTDEGVNYLAEALNYNYCELKSLNLWQNNVTDEGVKSLAEALKDSCKLNSLNLAGDKFTDEGVKYLAAALKHRNCQLDSIDLWQNNVTDEGVKYLAEALKHNNCKLKSLNLTINNKLTDEGVKYLAEALKDGNCKLKSLDLACNKLSDEEVKYVADTLKDSHQGHPTAVFCKISVWGSE